MIRCGIDPVDILIIAMYAEQKRCYQRLFKKLSISVDVSTVNGCQGAERPYVILDLITPGGHLYDLGFLKDVKRMDVVLSRARNGLIIVDNKEMALFDIASNAVDLWRRLIRHIVSKEEMINKSFGADIKEREILNVSGNSYKLYSTRAEWSRWLNNLIKATLGLG